jgi:hypothetical protein
MLELVAQLASAKLRIRRLEEESMQQVEVEEEEESMQAPVLISSLRSDVM